jgi:hypothetical protein
MAITSCYPAPKKQQQTVLTYDPQTGTTTSSVIETWVVTTDDINTRTSDIPALAAANTLPSPNAPLPLLAEGGWLGENALPAVVKRVQPKRTNEVNTAFEVEIEYQLATIYTSGQKFNASLTIDGVDSTVPVDVDMNGYAIANSAGDPYDPQQVVDSFEELVTISYQVDTPDEADLSAARGLVNSDSVSFTVNGITKSYSARQMKLKNASLTTQFNTATSGGGYSGAPMWTVKIDMLCKTGSATFETKLVDQGFQYWTGGSKVKFLDANGDPVNTPQYLNGTGGSLNVSAGSSPTVSSPYFNDFEMEDEYAFDSFLGGI